MMRAQTIETVSKLARYGNCLVFSFPQQGVDRLKLEAGDSIVVQVKADSITIRRAKARKHYTEKELLKGVMPAIAGPEIIRDRRGREAI